MLVLIDNYDSFTYNLYQYLCELGQEVEVVRNDQITIDELVARRPGYIVVSPGPCTPDKAGVSLSAVERFKDVCPVLGVCLGHQTIGQAFGGKVVPAKSLMHGKVSMIDHDGKSIFDGLSNPFQATRYHSLAIERRSIPDCFEVSAWTQDGEIMGLRHREFPVEGVQFHPESILTQYGHELLRNFLTLGNP